MRKVNKQDIVDHFRGQFLSGKSEKFVEKFNNSPLEKQYGSVTRWIKANKVNLSEEVTPKSINKYIQEISNLVMRLSDLNEDEANALRTNLDLAKEAINNFAANKRRQQIEALEAEHARILAQLEALKNF